MYSIHYVIKFVSDLWQVAGFHHFPPPMKLTARYNGNIVESGVKHQKPNPNNGAPGNSFIIEPLNLNIC